MEGVVYSRSPLWTIERDRHVLMGIFCPNAGNSNIHFHYYGNNMSFNTALYSKSHLHFFTEKYHLQFHLTYISTISTWFGVVLFHFSSMFKIQHSSKLPPTLPIRSILGYLFKNGPSVYATIYMRCTSAWLSYCI